MADGMSQGPRRGRPPLPPGEGKRYPLNTRTTKETRKWLEAVSKANGRSLAQELEFLIEQARLSEQTAREQLQQEFAGPHNYALAKIIAFLAGEIEDMTNARWTDDRDTFEEFELAIQTVLKRIETPETVVASGSPRGARAPSSKGGPSRGRWLALGLLDQVELSSADDGSEGGQVSRILRLSSEVSPTIGPLLKRTPKIRGGVRYVRGLVKVEPKTRTKA